MKQFIKTIAEWAILVGICYVLHKLGIMDTVMTVMGIIAYLGIGCLISGFCGDEPKPWLESHPVLLYTFHISIVFLWLPFAGLLLVWMGILFVLELFGISLEKKENGNTEEETMTINEDELFNELKAYKEGK